MWKSQEKSKSTKVFHTTGFTDVDFKAYATKFKIPFIFEVLNSDLTASCIFL